MTFTYTGSLATSLDELRFRIGDTVSGSGPRPSGTNFTDEELNALIAKEGNVNRAIAAVYEALAAAWAVEVDISVGPRSESYSQAAERYATLATQQRSRYGYSTGAMTYRAFTRQDGYSDDLDMTEV